MVLQFSYFTIYISAQQSSQVEPVSRTSGSGNKRLRLTTSQQNQSAKKKPEKSNNENEGNVSTIPQESDESGMIKILNISMMYLYTEFPNFGTNRILWYFLREHIFKSLNQHLIS
jgi:hypothetical protein